jgi:hypothetical protein
MFSIKKCTCGATAFAILVEPKTYIACTKCGVIVDPQDLPTTQVNAKLKLSHA